MYFNVLRTSASVSWRIPSFMYQEQYYVEYGTDPSDLDQSTFPIESPSDTTITNMTYSRDLTGLEPSTVYYFRVVAVFNEVFKRYSEVAALRTKEIGTSVIFGQSLYHLYLHVHTQNKSSIFHSLNPLMTMCIVEFYKVVMIAHHLR